MSVIIRLQNLPWSASASDIRAYFHGLSIPEGGVHIVGGEEGDAFIAFSTDEDARLAMRRDSGKLKEVMIKLFLSSRAEMLKVIEQARQQTLSLQQLIQANAVNQSPVVPDGANENSMTSLNQNTQDEEERGKDDEKDRRDRRRSRSRGRDRSRERSRRERRRWDRSRTRSRDRSYRSRRSKSRDRSRRDRSRDRESRRNRDDHEPRRGSNVNNSGGVDNDSAEFSGASWEQGSAPAKKTLLPDPVQTPVLPSQHAIPGQNNQIQTSLNPAVSKTETSAASKGIPKTDPQKMELSATDPQQASVGFFGDFPMMGFPGAIPGGMFPAMPMRNGTREGWPAVTGPGLAMAGAMPPVVPVFTRPMGPNEMGIPMGSFPPQAMQGGPFKPQMPQSWNFPSMSVMETAQESNTCVEIHGLPLNATYNEVRRLFDGLPIPQEGIKMINDNQGNRTGIAYVQFTQPQFKQTALSFNGKKVRGNIVEIMHLKDTLFITTPSDDMKGDKSVPDNTEGGWSDRMQMKFQDPRLNKGAGNSNSNSVNMRDGQALPQTDCVLMQGLPLKTNERDIFDFFSELGIAPIHIHIVLDVNGHPVGDAFCQFETPDEAEKASIKNKCHMGRQIVSVRTIAREELDKVRLDRSNERLGDRDMDRMMDRNERGERHDRGIERPGRGDPRMEGRDDRGVSDRDPRVQREDGRLDMGDPRGDRNMDPRVDRMERNPERPLGRGESGPFPGHPPFRPMYRGRMPVDMDEDRIPREEENPHHFRGMDGGRDRMMRRDMRGGPRGRGDSRGGRGGPGGPPFRSGPLLDAPQMRGGVRRRGSFPRFPPRPGHENAEEDTTFMEGDALESFGRPGCVVALENIHFRASVEDILGFFHGFEVDHEDVIRRFDDVGRPTGDARIALKTPEEAVKAVEVLNFKTMLGRSIKLSLIS